MGKIGLFLILLFGICVNAQKDKPKIIAVNTLTNTWLKAPANIPSKVAIDAPLMGNGDVKMSVGFKTGVLRYYLSKNDFWRLRSESDNLSGPRVVGFLDINFEGLENANFTAQQALQNGITTCFLKANGAKVEVKSWVLATDNLIFIELESHNKEITIRLNLSSPENPQANLNSGKRQGLDWITRSFESQVDIPTKVAVALKKGANKDNTIRLKPGKKLILTLAVESGFKHQEPLEYVLNKLENKTQINPKKLLKAHHAWWQTYWEKASITIQDSVLLKAYYQGLYTMAACSRDPKFPPGIFGWDTTDTPAWNGDYHLNYNFQAPFYALVSANRLAQEIPHDAPLLDFMKRGEWYAQNITKTRGILYPVGIGPLGIEVTRNHPNHKDANAELGGLFFGQRSNAAYGLVNMAQFWRCTYDIDYGLKIYPYVLDVVNFWEDFLKFEDGRYIIYKDAIHEGSGSDKNPILSLGLVRNAFDLAIDLSASLKKDEDRQDKWKSILAHLSSFPTQTRNNKTVFRYTEEGISWWNDNGLGIQHIYPANAITLDSSEELLSIAKSTIDEMQRWQDSNTSSSFFVAAIRVGYQPEQVLNELKKYAEHTYPNGFQLGNPHGIENSCTITNALNEMLCMSVGNTIRLFAGISKKEKASFKNIRTWGAFLVSACLENETISDVKIISEKGKPCNIINPWVTKKVALVRNGTQSEIVQGKTLTFNTRVQETIVLKPL